MGTYTRVSSQNMQGDVRKNLVVQIYHAHAPVASLLQLPPHPTPLPRLRISLRPFPQHLPLNLPTRRLGHFLDENHAARQSFMLGNPLRHPLLDVPFRRRILVFEFESNICAGKLFVIAFVRTLLASGVRRGWG